MPGRMTAAVSSAAQPSNQPPHPLHAREDRVPCLPVGGEGGVEEYLVGTQGADLVNVRLDLFQGPREDPAILAERLRRDDDIAPHDDLELGRVAAPPPRPPPPPPGSLPPPPP